MPKGKGAAAVPAVNPPKDSASSSASSSASFPGGPSSSPFVKVLTAIEKRIITIEKSQKKSEIRASVIQKKDLLNAEMKSYSDNVYIKGMKFSIKDAQGDEEKEEKFRESALLVLVEQGLLPAKRVFVQGSGPEKGRILRGVVRHAHPLGGKDNGTVVIAFLES